MRRLLVIAGFSRCGTTWLHQRLVKHSRIRPALGHVKEIGYFEWAHRDALNRAGEGAWGNRIVRSNRARFPLLEERIATLAARAGGDPAAQAQIGRWRGFIDRFGQDDDWYRGLFALGPDDWAIDSTPSYARLPMQAIRHMGGVAEEVRVVLLLREPAARLRSLLQHNRREQGRRVAREPGFAAALIRERDCPYRAGIEAYADALGPERLSVLFFEDLIREREPATATLLAGLGLDPEPALFAPEPAPNASRAQPFEPEALLALAAHSEAHVAGMRTFLGVVPPEWDGAAARLRAGAADALPLPPPADEQALLARARAQLGAQDGAGALETLAAVGDGQPVRHLLVARACLRLGRRDEARASLARFLAEEPHHAAGLALWARAFG